jgi:hypothetical protein
VSPYKRSKRKTFGNENDSDEDANGFDDDDLEDVAEGLPAVGVHLPDAKADQRSQGGV